MPKTTINQELTGLERIEFAYPDFIYPNPDIALRYKICGESAYNAIENDLQAGGILDIRKLSLVGKEWTLEANDKNRKSKYAHDLVEANLKNISFEQICMDLLDATLYGYKPAEIMWLRDGVNVGIETIYPRESHWFGFDVQRRLYFRDKTMPFGKRFDVPRKIMVHRFGAANGMYGKGLGRRLFWAAYMKRLDWDSLLKYLELFAEPDVIGIQSEDMKPDDVKQFQVVVSALRNHISGTIPHGADIKVYGPDSGTGATMYEKVMRYIDEQVSFTVTGQTLSSNAKSTGLGSGVADLQNEIRHDILKADGDLLAQTLNNQLIRWICELNGIDTINAPKIWWNTEPKEDDVKRADVDTKIYSMGYEPTDKYIKERYGDGWVKREEVQETNPANSPVPPTEPPDDANLSDNDDTVAEIAKQLAIVAEKTVAETIDTVIASLQDADDWADIPMRLLQTYPNMHIKDFAELLRDARINARLNGQNDGTDAL